MGTNKAKNWVERNPKITIFLVLVPVLITIVFAFEKYFAYQNRKNLINANYHYRSIRLRESPPLLSNYLWPLKNDLEVSDALKCKKYLFRIDKNGFLIPSEIYPNPDKVIVFLGGSTTECSFIDEEKRFPYQVGCLLEQKLDQKINSYNGGNAGNNSMHSLFVLMSKVIPLKPTAVIMMHNINDLIMLLYEGSYYSTNPTKSIIITEDYSSLHLIRDFIKNFIPNIYMAALQVTFIREFVQSAKYGDEFADVKGGKVISDQDKAKIINEFGTNLQLFIDICQTKGITPVLMTMPSRVKDIPDDIIFKAVKMLRVDLNYREFKELFDNMNETIRSKAHENGIMVIDLARQIPQDPDHMYDIVHLTDKGCKRAAEIISGDLSPLLSK